MSIKVGVVGAAGFAGVELVRLLLEHPTFELRVITSDADAGTPLSKAYPAFLGKTALSFTAHANPELQACDAVFLAVPHTAALARVPAFLEAGISVIDLSADYRLKDAAVYEKWYETKHTSPNLLKHVAFGLPELFRSEIDRMAAEHAAGKPAFVACAGCYPTATSLAAFPAVAAGLVRAPVVVDAISGVTGAGKKASSRTHYCFADESLEAYGVGKHRHTPEIEQILGLSNQVIFTPHLAPLKRGLLSTVTLPLASGRTAGRDAQEIYRIYQEFYEQSAFVQLLPWGEMPKSASVVGSNSCHIGLAHHVQTDTLIAVGAIDNLCKGAAGQAVQCANIVCGLPETAGLSRVALPV